MIRGKQITDLTWKTVRELLDAGWTQTAISTHLKGVPTLAQISAWKRRTEKKAYFEGKENRFAKFQTEEYKNWRSAVLKRDGFRCVVCKRGKPEVKVLQADHILSWSRHPESRFDIDNGRTLCLYHHKRTLNYGFKAINCDDELNGAAWVIRERLLWNKRIKEKDRKGLQKLRNINWN